MSRKNLGVMIVCDICGAGNIKDMTDIQMMTEECRSVYTPERGVEVSIKGYGHNEDIDICLDCRINFLERSIECYRRYK